MMFQPIGRVSMPAQSFERLQLASLFYLFIFYFFGFKCGKFRHSPTKIGERLAGLAYYFGPILLGLISNFLDLYNKGVYGVGGPIYLGALGSSLLRL